MRRKNLVLLMAAVLLSIAAFSRQEKLATISGTVKDARTKLPIPEAVITLRSSSFEGEKYALTNSAGMYHLGNLPAGTYNISFEMEGYKKISKDSIVVSPGMLLAVKYEMIKERKKRKIF